MNEILPPLQFDIHTTVIVVVGLLICIGILLIWYGRRTIQYGIHVSYGKKRQQFIQRGWLLVLWALVIVMGALAVSQFAEPLIYTVYIPSPTITTTPTITLTPTKTLVPTLTSTPTLTLTPAISPTPVLPPDLLELFTAEKTPNLDALFSPIQFSEQMDEFYQPIDPQTSYQPGVTELFATFSFDQMIPGSQWTAVWVAPNGSVPCYETIAWGDYTGGYGYTQCIQAASEWQIGFYEVRFFLGETWITTGTFEIAILDESSDS